jgi:hypothetical protein
MLKKFISMTTAVLLMASGVSLLGTNTAQAAICSGAELLESSSTIKGVTFTKGTRLESSNNFNGGGSTSMGSITLTAAQASGTGTTSITASGGATATWLYVAPSIRSWGNADISTTDDHQNVTFEDGLIFEIKITGTGCVDYYRLQIIVTRSTPSRTAAEIAAAAAQAAEAASNAGRMIREGKLIEAKKSLSTQLKGGVAGTKEEFIAAKINVTTDASLARLNAEVLKLAVADRSDFEKIKALAAAIEFDETFFNESARPNTSMYAAQGVAVSERTLAAINAKILELPAEKRLDVVAIQEIAKNENFIDRIANPLTRSLISASSLVSRGLIPADYARKQTVIRNLEGYEEASLNTVAKIEAAIKEEMLKADARDLRYKAIVAKIAARSSK